MSPVSGPPRDPTTRVEAAGDIRGALRKSPRQQRSRETIRFLLEAAAQLFDEDGLDVTTNRIAERAGFSIGTLYQYFPNKQAMLLALAGRHVEETYDHLRATFDQLREQEPDWPRAVRTLVAAALSSHRDRPRLHSVMYQYTPRTAAGVARLRSLHEMLIAETATELRRCGRDTNDAERTAALFVHAAEAHLHHVVLGRGGDPEEVTAALLAMTQRPADR